MDPARLVDDEQAPPAVSVPAIRPQMAAADVIRFQNMPMMNVANSGALKIENSACR